ncbi:hypothetical protein TOPH_01893 [Tolypocladium ophioglossoides CBS 100239]|uniref:Uncharacterized protein n=1 Tax=Tolypocladium ophioglossoides (strain CBS 100239) TaxID=1163406 RepID=A0A0L0NI43_TOLOC|nr:hypothetical protein TOPH_01893 [Tolypocladium ophioglossoides CBS 100239]
MAAVRRSKSVMKRSKETHPIPSSPVPHGQRTAKARLLAMPKRRPDIGLTKGYVEALEHRLEITEDALLQILSVAGDDIVESAYGSGGILGKNPSGAACAVRASITGRREVRKTDFLARWEQFPLSTADDVRIWAQHAFRRPARHSEEHLHGRAASPTLPNTDGGMEEPSASAGNDVLSGTEEAMDSTPSPGRELQADHEHGLRESTPPLSDNRSGEDAQSFALSLGFRKQYLW